MEKKRDGYNRLSLEERQQIERGIKNGFSNAEISRHLGRSKNVVNTEVRRNGCRDTYNAIDADKLSEERKSRRYAHQSSILYSPEQRESVRKLHENGFSFWDIRLQTKIPYIVLSTIFKNLKINQPHAYILLEKLNDKVYALEQQIEILFELLKEKK